MDSFLFKVSYCLFWLLNFFLLLKFFFLSWSLCLISLKISKSMSDSYTTWRTLIVSSLVYSTAWSWVESLSQISILSNWGLSLRTIPTIKFSLVNCSPSIARSKSSQNLDDWFFYDLMLIRHPFSKAGSSHAGLIPYWNTWRLVPYGIAVGLLKYYWIIQNCSTY